jgi:hypothetical protein
MIRYRLDDLGWFQFESLIQSLLKAKYGIGIESWGGRGDYGRDAFFNGTIELIKNNHESGSFIFQVKFVEEANAAGANPELRLIPAIQAEIRRIDKRKQSNEKIKYILITNVNLSAKLRKKVQALLQDRLPSFSILLLGAKDVCDVLDNFPHIRSAFPQILGLSDLDTLLARIISKPAIERSKAMIEAARELAGIFYPTEAYNQCLHNLSKHFFAVLEGPPEVGKTSIAIMISLARLSNDWDAYECLSPNEFFQLYATDRSQIFIADDAFGSTEFDPSKTNEWSLNLDRIFRRLDQSHWLIWTARKHILQLALEKLRLQGKAENFPEPGALLVDAGNLTDTEKALILYRHAKMAILDDASKKILKTHVKTIVNHKHFTPERIRRFVKYSLPAVIEQLKAKNMDQESLKLLIQKEIREPTKSLKQAFLCLEIEHKDLLISRLDLTKKDAYFYDEKDFRRSYARHKHQSSSKSYDQIENDLTLSFLKPKSNFFYLSEGWVHPSMRDLVIDYLIENDTERRRFLENCSLSGITLALSFAGGQEGNRLFPFVIDKSDMKILNRKIEEMIRQGNSELLKQLFTFINEAVVNWDTIELNKKEFISDLLNVSLQNILDRWNKDQSTINNDLLSLYFKMVKKASRYFPSPPLEYIWRYTVRKFDEKLAEQDKRKVLEAHSYIKDILQLFNIIEENEPRFISYIDYPNCVKESFKIFLNIAIKEANEQYSFNCDDPGDLFKLYDNEKDFYDDLGTVVGEIQDSDVLREDGYDLDYALESVNNAQSYYEGLATENYIPDEDEREDHSKSETTADVVVKVEEIFRDL